MYYSLHVCLAGERVLCPHASRIPAPAQYITEPMKTREIRTGFAVVRHINNETEYPPVPTRGTNTTVTPCRCTSGRPYCRLRIPTPYHPHAYIYIYIYVYTYICGALLYTRCSRRRCNARLRNAASVNAASPVNARDFSSPPLASPATDVWMLSIWRHRLTQVFIFIVR